MKGAIEMLNLPVIDGDRYEFPIEFYDKLEEINALIVKNTGRRHKNIIIEPKNVKIIYEFSPYLKFTVSLDRNYKCLANLNDFEIIDINVSNSFSLLEQFVKYITRGDKVTIMLKRGHYGV